LKKYCKVCRSVPIKSLKTEEFNNDQIEQRKEQEQEQEQEQEHEHEHEHEHEQEQEQEQEHKNEIHN